MCGHYFTENYVEDMENYFAEKEVYDKAAVVRDYRKMFIGAKTSQIY
jgi:hypothetical protein